MRVAKNIGNMQIEGAARTWQDATKVAMCLARAVTLDRKFGSSVTYERHGRDDPILAMKSLIWIGKADKMNESDWKCG